MRVQPSRCVVYNVERLDPVVQLTSSPSDLPAPAVALRCVASASPAGPRCRRGCHTLQLAWSFLPFGLSNKAKLPLRLPTFTNVLGSRVTGSRKTTTQVPRGSLQRNQATNVP